MDTKKDARIKKTEQKLLNGLTELLLTQDIDHISVSDLVKSSKINRSTFYLRYDTIADYYKDLEQRLFNSLKTELNTILTKQDWHDYMNTPSLITFDAIKFTVQFLEANPAMQAILTSKSYGSQFIELNATYYVDLAWNYYKDIIGEERKEQFNYMYSFLTYGLIHTIILWLKNDRSLEIDEFTKGMKMLVYSTMQNVKLIIQ